ncbi:acyl-CoA thioesterase-1 [Pacificibacter maritimus]|uniref:Acyl-CoA thioesterase-1 n=1 Tax=Pacificibacter maritimus TaxID=762213 RepID=A0A3N4U9L3_9RHOB|nr:acyl-CoA thioesterase-1 [Pacificibacter maritimus]
MVVASLIGAGTAVVAQDGVTIAALGDSLTQGYGLPQSDGFTAQLQAWLTAQGQDITILNAGVSGDTTTGGLARIEWTLTPDVDAMIVALGGNDVLRGTAPELARANLDAILSIAQTRDIPVLLVGIAVPENYGVSYKAEFSAIYPELSQAYDTLYFEDFLQPISKDRDMADALSNYMQNDGVHPNAQGVALIVEDLGPKVIELGARVSD